MTSYTGWTYTYNAENRLSEARLYNLPKAQFTYDAVGRCVRRTIDGLTTVLTYDQWTAIAEWDGSGNLVATNVYGLGDDEILSRSAGSTQLFYKSDPMGNVRFVLNAAGTMVESYTYDAFGAATIKDASGTVISDSAVGNRFMYKGREYLASLGVYDSRKRIYHPGLGRFLQVDPKGFDGGDASNLYRFCMHNPMTAGDPMGEDFTGLSVADPYFSFTNDPLASAGFSNFGAFDAPVATVMEKLNSGVVGAEGLTSGTSTAQGGNMGQHPQPFATIGCGLSLLQSGSANQATSQSLSGRVVDLAIGEGGGATWGRMLSGPENIFSGQGWTRDGLTGWAPKALAEGIRDVNDSLPPDARENGYHAWHAGSNARMAQQLGAVGAPLIFAAGVFHEVDFWSGPHKYGSFGEEQESQGTVNHVIDSTMDIIANGFGMAVGYTVPGQNGVNDAIQWGNRIPGPTNPVSTGSTYHGNPADAWGPYKR